MGNETGSNSAFIQMSNRESAEFCIMIINGTSIFHRTIEISISSHVEITDTVPNNDSVQGFYSEFYNQFKSNFSSKSKVYYPSQTLHFFFNVPSTFTAGEIAIILIFY